VVAAGAEVLTAVGLSKQIAEEQAALRRVATLVARPAPPAEVFAAVTAEVGRLLKVDFTVLKGQEARRSRGRPRRGVDCPQPSAYLRRVWRSL
jgi:hypothetical protein